MPEKTRVLIVDDNANICTTLTDILVEHKFEVSTAGTATEALQKIDQESFATVLIDIRLPDMHGVELLKKIKEKKPKVTCIIMTAYPEERPEDTLELGASGYFIKPINIDKLKELLMKSKK